MINNINGILRSHIWDNVMPIQPNDLSRQRHLLIFFTVGQV